MSNSILIIIWIAFMALFLKMRPMYRKEYVCGKVEYRLIFGYAFLVFLPVIIWAGFRGGIADTYAYIKSFNEMPSTVGMIPQYMNGVTKDKGFVLISALIKAFITKNSTVYLLILAAVQGVILVSVYRKYSTNYLLCIFLFIASTDYLSWMFNGLRQFTAVTVIFAATELMIQKKYIPLIIVILLASRFHGSALLMIPFVFIMQGKAWNKKTILFIIITILILAYVDQFTNLLDAALADTQYTNVVSDWQMSNDDGTNIIRVFVYSIPAALSFVGRKYIEGANDPIVNLCTNAAILSAAMYFISSVTSGIYIGRLPIYVSLYSYILLAWELDNMFTKESTKIMKILLVGCYLIFYWYQLLAWGNI